MEPVGGLLQLLDQRLQFSIKLPAFGPFVVLVVVLVIVTISLDAEGREGADRRRIIGRRTVEILDLGRGLYGLVEIVSALQRIRQTATAVLKTATAHTGLAPALHVVEHPSVSVEVLLQPNVGAIDAIDDRRELFLHRFIVGGIGSAEYSRA
jgi:hypothetical protein